MESETKQMASKGGKARAESLTADERSEIARKAAQKRWETKKTKPKKENR